MTSLGRCLKASELRKAVATSTGTKATTGARFAMEEEVWAVHCYWEITRVVKTRI